MKTTLRIALVTLLLPAALHARQDPPGTGAPGQPVAPAPEVVEQPGVQPPATPEGAPTAQPPAHAAQATGLPAQPGPPRTLRAYLHLFIAFAVAWVLLFAYAISIGARLARVERRLGDRR